MKTKIKILFPFTIILFVGFVSCKKDNSGVATSVKVTIYDSVVHRALKNRSVFLRELKGNSFSFFNSSHEIETIKYGTTDVNGQCDFGTFDAKESNKYSYEVWDDQGSVFHLNKAASNSHTFIQYNFAMLHINFIPAPPYGTSDYLKVAFYNVTQPNLEQRVYDSYYIPNRLYVVKPGNCLFIVDKYKSGVSSGYSNTYNLDIDTVFEFNVFW